MFVYQCLKCESVSRRFQPGKGPRLQTLRTLVDYVPYEPSFEAVVQQPDKSGNVGKNAEMCGQRGDGARCCSRGAAGGGHNTAEY